jgi:hypothetical protein
MMVIGHGGSSTVYLDKAPNGIGTSAIKHFHPEISESDLIREIAVLVGLNDPCILQIHGFGIPWESGQEEIHT